METDLLPNLKENGIVYMSVSELPVSNNSYPVAQCLREVFFQALFCFRMDKIVYVFCFCHRSTVSGEREWDFRPIIS